MGKWGYALGTFIDRLDWILVGLTTTAMAFITVISFIEVVSRYCFNAPHGWVAEIVVLLMVWTVFLAVGPGLKRGNHVAVSFLADALHGRVRRLHQVFVNLCSFVVLSVVTWLGVYLFMDLFRFGGYTETLMLPHWIALIPFLVGMLVGALYSLDGFVKVFQVSPVLIGKGRGHG